uniref:CYTH domain-containing protein n=1 Tax=Tetradesmus obliquus TaxID=3088 RepID=A0A383VV85_TETOB
MTGGDRAGAPAKSRGLLKEKLELEKVKTKDGRTRVTLKPIPDDLTFDKGFYVFIRALQLLRSHNEGVVLVGLGGASGSGKTAFSEKVKDFMPGIVVISMDNYNDGSKVVDGNFDDPRLTDYDLLLSNLSDLKAGKSADIPIYDFKQSKRVGFTTTPVPSSRVVVLEGIYALNERLKHLLDLRVSIAGGVHFDLVKRVLRDISRSGQGPEEIIQQITDTVYPMYKAFIEPDLNAAQLKIHNSFNPFTGFMNATYILKAKRQQELSQQAVVAVLGADAVTKTESEMYDIHLLPPNEDPETCASWLRMRNRDGRYTLLFEEWVTEGPFIISPRIQFEVSVRVLGGLMSLGYQIGTIMRRTSTIVSGADGVTSVKFDDVEGLGKYVQVQGKDRDKVASTAEALGLTDFIPRSYIEQVQLSKLVDNFQTFTDDVKRRFSMSSNPSAAPDDVYGQSPPLFGGLLGRSPLGGSRGAAGLRGGRFGRHARGSTAAAAAAAAFGDDVDDDEAAEYGGSGLGDEALLSCSAPVRGSRPIAIQPPARKAAAAGGSSSLTSAAANGGDIVSPSSSAAAAAGSTVGCGSIVSAASSIDGNGSPAGSIENGSAAAAAAAAGFPGSAGGAAARVAGVPPSGHIAAGGSGGSESKRTSLLGQQLRRGSNHGSSSSLGGGDAAPAAAAAAPVGTPEGQSGGFVERSERSQRVSAIGTGDFGAEVGVQALRRLQEQMEVVAEGFKRHSGMQLHLDALTHQYKHLNESMAALTAATQALGGCVQQLQQQQQTQQPGQQQASGSSSGSSSIAGSTTAAAAGLGAWLPRSLLQGGSSSSSSVGLGVFGAGVLLGAAAGAALSRAAAAGR